MKKAEEYLRLGEELFQTEEKGAKAPFSSLLFEEEPLLHREMLPSIAAEKQEERIGQQENDNGIAEEKSPCFPTFVAGDTLIHETQQTFLEAPASIFSFAHVQAEEAPVAVRTVGEEAPQMSLMATPYEAPAFSEVMGKNEIKNHFYQEKVPTARGLEGRFLETVFDGKEGQSGGDVHIHNEIPAIHIEFSGSIDKEVDVEALMGEIQKRLQEEMEAGTDFYYRC